MVSIRCARRIASFSARRSRRRAERRSSHVRRHERDVCFAGDALHPTLRWKLGAACRPVTTRASRFRPTTSPVTSYRRLGQTFHARGVLTLLAPFCHDDACWYGLAVGSLFISGTTCKGKPGSALTCTFGLTPGVEVIVTGRVIRARDVSKTRFEAIEPDWVCEPRAR
jgi:hypothetical protein